ncbi:endonuclease/exonuclease/phosphatase family protein [Alkalihalobacillus sp. LMS39]|uniref:endonuclease/exonuclease/phosphatase family protein n=1 Tax=Alkalihalobacillus sp. LMS39 TaxID=2924032 RepID=UPI001FB22996|nr:endonuclease/exonuclease/phosphatase family protein [Alkalihalobacillus sp. LMS39]UOE94010.1 endonuclease/exonuclease/phosphatase family protein [Alkalihalobacillus sp. LMS39]
MSIIKIKIVTFNIRHGKGSFSKVNLEKIKETIEKTQADIVGINEVDCHFSKRSNFVDQPGWLGEALNMDWRFGPAIKGTYGNLLLSKYPIRHSENDIITTIPPFENRSILQCDVEINEKIIKIFVSHFALHPLLRKKHEQTLLEKVKTNENNVIVMGDFNQQPNSRFSKQMRQYVNDVSLCAGRGKGYTFPAVYPLFRLDFIYVSRTIGLIDVEVISTKASDHLPILATIEI